MSFKKILKKLLNVNCIKIISYDFDQISHALYIHLDMTKGKKHHCPICGKKSPHYDKTIKRKNGGL